MAHHMTIIITERDCVHWQEMEIMLYVYLQQKLALMWSY